MGKETGKKPEREGRGDRRLGGRERPGRERVSAREEAGEEGGWWREGVLGMGEKARRRETGRRGEVGRRDICRTRGV